MSESNLILKNISKSYHQANNSLSILKDISLEVKSGDFIAVTGPSGSGKSTLLSIIGTLDNADSGKLIINGVSIEDNINIYKLRNKSIGFIFQFHNLIFYLLFLELSELYR